MDTHPTTRITMWWWKTFFKLKTKIKMVLYLRENLSNSMMNSNCRHHLFLNILFFREWVMFCLWFWQTSVFCFSSFIQYWAWSIIYCFPFSCTANVSLDLCLSIGLKKYFNKGFQKKKREQCLFVLSVYICMLHVSCFVTRGHCRPLWQQRPTSKSGSDFKTKQQQCGVST